MFGNFFDRTSMTNFYLSRLASNSTPKKNPKICELFLKNLKMVETE